MAGLKEVARHAGVKPNVIKQVFAAMVTMMGEDNAVPIKIQGFGTFEVYTIPGRIVASPVINGGEPVQIQEQLGVKFHASDLAKRRINTAAERRVQQGKRMERIMADPPKKAAKKPIAAKPARASRGKS